eukprot:TRINITY_DN5938_c1_g1_i1.p1 TRINITY_DN5938_c1_g1~~TRINITY_DN5938_c1_g1_i1.p1  ORF type:complete len:502 (-),score=43.13 TRINITY_DN5938_c1_g1_i1:546-2051(-)
MLSSLQHCCCRQFCGSLEIRQQKHFKRQVESFSWQTTRRKQRILIITQYQKKGKQQKGLKNSPQNNDKDKEGNFILEPGQESMPVGIPKDSMSEDGATNMENYPAVFQAHQNLFIKDPQRSYLKSHIVLSETKFRSRHRLARVMSQILQKPHYHDGKYLKELPAYLVKALLQYHPDVEGKRLYDIKYVYVDSPPPPHPKHCKCFWIERHDGSVEDVSYRKCIMSRYTPLGTFIRASKFQCLNLYNQYKKQLFSSGETVYCAKTGVKLKDQRECIITCEDQPFEYVISQFVFRYRIDVASIQYVIKTGQNNRRSILISSAGLRMQLERYFRSNVNLCAVHKFYYIKQFNLISKYCTSTGLNSLKQMNQWNQFESLGSLDNYKKTVDSEKRKISKQKNWKDDSWYYNFGNAEEEQRLLIDENDGGVFSGISKVPNEYSYAQEDVTQFKPEGLQQKKSRQRKSPNLTTQQQKVLRNLKQIMEINREDDQESQEDMWEYNDENQE